MKREHWGEDVPPIADCPCFKIGKLKRGKMNKGTKEKRLTNPHTEIIPSDLDPPLMPSDTHHNEHSEHPLQPISWP